MQTWTWFYPETAALEYADATVRSRSFKNSPRFNACYLSGEFSKKLGKNRHFASMWVIRELLRHAPQLEVWQERYKLAIASFSKRSVYGPFNAELTRLLTPAVKHSIERQRFKLQTAKEFKDPDVLTFDPATNAWQFFEVKKKCGGYADKWGPGQEESLLLLEQLVPNSTSILLNVCHESLKPR